MNQRLEGPNPQQIRFLFSSIADGYDRANDWMTLGLARVWRTRLVRWSGVKEGDKVLDCATGTGDLAIAFSQTVGDRGRVVGTDFCKEMLALAKRKSHLLEAQIEFQLADVLNLPFASGQFDVVSIAYGVRNVADPLLALREMARVCKPGGRVMILETGDSRWPILQSAIKAYFHHVVPRLGGYITGERWAYEYLNRSSQEFPAGRRFVSLMKETGRFEDCSYRSLLGGASFIYRGVVTG